MTCRGQSGGEVLLGPKEDILALAGMQVQFWLTEAQTIELE